MSIKALNISSSRLVLLDCLDECLDFFFGICPSKFGAEVCDWAPGVDEVGDGVEYP